MYQFPIKYYKDNLIFSDNGCWAGYELIGYDYENRSKQEKENILRNLIAFLRELKNDAKILIVPKRKDYKNILSKNYKEMKSEDPLKEIAQLHTETIVEYLDDKKRERTFINTLTGEEIRRVEDEVTEYRTFLFIKLEENKLSEVITNIRDVYEYALKSPQKAIEGLIGKQRIKVLDSKIRAFEKAIKVFKGKVSVNVNLRILKSKELQLLYKRINRRGIDEEIKSTNFNPKAYYKQKGEDIELIPDGNDIKCLFAGKMKPKDRYVEFVSDYGTSYQSFLTFSEIPDLEFTTNSEFLYYMQELTFPIETCIHITPLDEEESKKECKELKKPIVAEFENAGEEYSVETKVYEAREEIEDMEAELYANKVLMKMSLNFCVSADNLDKLEKRVDELKKYFSDREYEIVRPVTDQYKMYMDMIPGTGRYTEDYKRLVSISSVASMGIGASNILGDEFGKYIGFTGPLSTKVLLDMKRACLENQSACATFYGNLGYGKSFNANLITILNVIYGGYALIIDPKAERSDWAKHIPWLADLISVVRLSSGDEYKGVMDPFNIYKSSSDKDSEKYRNNIEEAADLALDIITGLCNIAVNDDEYIIISEVLSKVKVSDKPSMQLVIKYLDEFDKNDKLFEKAEKLARRLRTFEDVGMAKLLIGDGTEKAINFNNRINILQIDNLELPDSEVPESQYTPKEKLSKVLFGVMGHFAKRFAMMDVGEFKTILFDESWAIKSMPGGIKLLDFLTRMGRSLFTGTIFNGHSVLDIPSDKIKNTISYKFCFRTKEVEEAKRMCEYLKIDVSEYNISKIMSLENRECMFRDLDGRVGKLTFDAVLDEFITAFSTTPKKKEKKESIEPPQGGE